MQDFFDYLAPNVGITDMTKDEYLKRLYDDFVDYSNMAYEESVLEDKYDDFKYIMQ